MTITYKFISPLQEHITATYTVKLKSGHETWENLQDPEFLAKQLEI